MEKKKNKETWDGEIKKEKKKERKAKRDEQKDERKKWTKKTVMIENKEKCWKKTSETKKGTEQKQNMKIFWLNF